MKHSRKFFFWKGRARQQVKGKRFVQRLKPRDRYLRVASDVHTKIAGIANRHRVTMKYALEILLRDVVGL